MRACLLAGANVIDGVNVIDGANVIGGAILYVHACLLLCLLAGANVIDGALGQVIKVTLLENPYS